MHPMIGKTFAHLTVMSVATSAPDGHSQWNCKCKCGGETVVKTNNLKSGNTKSCGCLHKMGNANRRGTTRQRKGA